MAINLADNNPRVVYTVAEGASQSVFAVPFEFFEDSDIKVYVDGTLKAEGTDYTLSGGDGATGTLTFNSAVVGATGGSSVLLFRRIAIERTTDFQQGLEISRAALNAQLDTLTALVADMNDRWDRAIHIPDSDVGQVVFELPDSSTRAGNYFAFDGNGDPVMTSGTTSEIIVSVFGETIISKDNGGEVLTALGVTSAGQALLDDADAAAQRTTLGLAAGATTGALNTSDWEAGTSTTEAIVSPAKVSAAITSLVPPSGLEYYDGVDGVIYDHAVDGDQTYIETPNFEDGYEYAVLFVGMANNRLLSIDVYWSLDAAWKESVNVNYYTGKSSSINTASATGTYIVDIPLPRLGIGAIPFKHNIQVSGATAATNSASKANRLRFSGYSSFARGTWTAGKAIMLRRAVNL
jgi:hypothetical protein